MELTEQEYKIANEIAFGLSEKEIASKLFISPDTVHTHTYNMRKRNGWRNAVDIARAFILSLENPKEYFSAVILLMVQLFAVFTLHTQELRRVPKLSSKTNYSRIYRKPIKLS